MKCEFDYCIYNKDHSCIFKEIEINQLGMCDDCIMVTISTMSLEILKERQLEDIENR